MSLFRLVKRVTAVEHTGLIRTENRRKKVELGEGAIGEGAIGEGAIGEGAIGEGAIGEGEKRRRVDLIRWFGYIHCNRIVCIGYAIK